MAFCRCIETPVRHCMIPTLLPDIIFRYSHVIRVDIVVIVIVVVVVVVVVIVAFVSVVTAKILHWSARHTSLDKQPHHT
jgi:hypothetical protein